MNQSEVYKILTGGHTVKKFERKGLYLGNRGLYMVGGIISASDLGDGETDNKPSRLQNQTFLSNI